ncbi:MAG: SDR family oxidoreductase [Dehalococcoidia bacterium]|jgi:NAD(P)-dependent dehydrogenase (short-subunit alcohol dehydrogenase family)|uniref:2-deoxy-D-gluconate 3-dehydrogenase n=1 Tax=marine metagenome TaxID=408172 RepID=A0A381P2E7_9ZZZZ|nr:2-deoxy-D-gluconate 3-dehydrogenase [Dehalococcoidia bacterium]MCS5647877.1 SDR family oxidoreductase [Dehalococcoidia bacterium]MEC7913282.1 SDR family oxidoreductase [Chloroflexota bacterium]HAT22688.1 2-deoxy-D-gluconate 3-dehydrogenase [Dehalococcoidia bacterium]|tara:strand:- start:863 stop:1630 length:768 start_codon:yes stop_codon:yes gene_type:complete
MPLDSFNLSGKVALVTGGNSGIGLGMAKGLAESGADVCIWGTNIEKNERSQKELSSIGIKSHAIKCDVSSEDQVETSFQETLDIFGKVDSCFANAGAGGGAPFHEFPTDLWRKVMGINLDGTFFTFRAASKHMIERGEGGRLVGTSSTSAIHGAARNEAYASTKGAMLAMVRGLAVEMARYGITANSIIPGWIETAMTSARVGDERFEDRVMKRVPIRRWGTPEDFAGIAVYLASDASSYQTGEEFVVDGGYTRF